MNRDAPNSESSHRGDTIGRNAIFAFATQMSTAAFTAALTLYESFGFRRRPDSLLILELRLDACA